jgi:signal transduction histidine kinase/CheY-like chemotaxis protein
MAEGSTSSLGAGEDLGREQQSWRERVLRGLLWTATATFAVVGGGVVWLGVYGAEGNSIFIGCGLVALSASIASRLPYPLRAAALLTIVTVATLYALVRAGYAPNVFIACGFVIVTATLLFGARGGVGFVAFFTLALIAISTLHRTGVLTRVSAWPTLLDSARPENIARVAVNFLALSLSAVIALAYLLRRGEELLLEKTRSLERLGAEQSEKERIQSELALREAAFRKAAELEVLGRLAGSMAHDYNNALVVIFGAVDDLSRLELSPEARQAVLAIKGSATQAASATRQLRAFGQQATPSPSYLPVGPAVRRLYDLLKRVVPSNIELALEAESDVAIHADEGQIQRMLTNLVLNARDAMRDGGKISLRVTRKAATNDEPPFAVLSVEDDGAGMSETVRARLFEPFFTTKGGAGTGLGLASVQKTAEAAGGRVEVASEVGRGSTISVYWPLAEPAPGKAAKSPARVDGSGINVLLVDDDKPVRTALARGLRHFGFTVLEAANAQEGLLAARRHGETLHVLCTDCAMPGIPVAELISGFREVHAGGQVLVCSGYAPEAAGNAAGAADDFLAKPFDISELAKRLHGLTNSRAQPSRARTT